VPAPSAHRPSRRRSAATAAAPRIEDRASAVAARVQTQAPDGEVCAVSPRPAPTRRSPPRPPCPPGGARRTSPTPCRAGRPAPGHRQVDPVVKRVGEPRAHHSIATRGQVRAAALDQERSEQTSHQHDAPGPITRLEPTLVARRGAGSRHSSPRARRAGTRRQLASASTQEVLGREAGDEDEPGLRRLREHEREVRERERRDGQQAQVDHRRAMVQFAVDEHRAERQAEDASRWSMDRATLVREPPIVTQHPAPARRSTAAGHRVDPTRRRVA